MPYSNPEKAAANRKRYYETHKREIRLRQKKYDADHKERMREYRQQWAREHPHSRTATYFRYRIKRKFLALSPYGRACACCGETNLGFLSLDHVGGNGDGAAHRQEVPSTELYSWVIKNGHPPGFQVLCYNCNQGRAKRGNVCPHKEPSLTMDDVIPLVGAPKWTFRGGAK